MSNASFSFLITEIPLKLQPSLATKLKSLTLEPTVTVVLQCNKKSCNIPGVSSFCLVVTPTEPPPPRANCLGRLTKEHYAFLCWSQSVVFFVVVLYKALCMKGLTKGYVTSTNLKTCYKDQYLCKHYDKNCCLSTFLLCFVLFC